MGSEADTGIIVGPSGTKRPWESKTVIVNAILAFLLGVSYFSPGAMSIADWIKHNSDLIASIWSLLNIVLRFISKDQITLTD